ncbi:glutamine cyclotransferase [Pelagophyceae sp. CCMP2097]|nr:glutamine cyclotransferase [Pelagophyceae sp. CCMP2097]
MFRCSFVAVVATAAWSEALVDADGDAALRGAAAPSAAFPTSYVCSYRIVKTFPHDGDAFTQGLAFDEDGTLYESDGMYRESRVRRVDVATGSSFQATHNAHAEFGEGLTVVGDKLVQLTWRERTLIEYDKRTLAKLRTVRQPVHEGWGLAADGDTLYMTDGGAELRTFAAGTYDPLDAHTVRDPRLQHLPVDGLNELEFVDGQVWANIYPMRHHKASNCVARIDPKTGFVVGWIDFSGLVEMEREVVRRHRLDYVLNGLAFHPATRTLYVTGKKWGSMHQVELVETDLGTDHVRKTCNLYMPLAKKP